MLFGNIFVLISYFEKRYKDGIQWHDVPCFFRSAIICEVKISWNISLFLKLNYCPGRYLFNYLIQFWWFSVYQFLMMVERCRTPMFRWRELRGREGWMLASPPHLDQIPTNTNLFKWKIDQMPTNTNLFKWKITRCKFDKIPIYSHYKLIKCKFD